METSEIIAQIDAEIVKLKKARTILSGVSDTEKLTAVVADASKPAKPGLSAASRKKIAKAQKARWAKVRKAAKKTVQA